MAVRTEGDLGARRLEGLGLYDGCVASSCDATYSYGKIEYDKYVACMAQQCATCGVKDGGY
jgi:hypothetical protein